VTPLRDLTDFTAPPPTRFHGLQTRLNLPRMVTCSSWRAHAESHLNAGSLLVMLSWTCCGSLDWT